MKFNLICIGKTDDREITSLISNYLPRIPKHWNFEIIEIPDVKNAKNLSPDLLKKELMIMDLKASTKMEAIDEMIARLKEKNIISDEVIFKDLILKREGKSSTGLGEGIAMPHAKTSVVNTPAVLFARSNKGIDYDALDGEPVYIFFMIAASEGAHDLHIDTLAKLSKMLLNDNFTQGLKTCGTPDEV